MISRFQPNQKNLANDQGDGQLSIAVEGSKKGNLIDERGELQQKYHDQYQQEIERYLDMQTIGPDWKFAQKHGESTRPGKPKMTDNRQQCICCLREIIKQPIGLCQDTKQLVFLGYGFPLYFIFIKYAMVILLLQIINYTSIELYRSINRNYDFCVNHIDRKFEGETVKCTSWMVLLSNISPGITTDQHVMRLTSFLALLVILIYVRHHFTNIWMYYDERQTTYGDFSIFVSKIPSKKVFRDHSRTIGERLRAFFADESIFPSKPKIAKINLIGYFQKLQKLQHRKKDLTHQLQLQISKNKQLQKEIESHKNLMSEHANEGLQINQMNQVPEKVKTLIQLIKNQKLQIKSQKIRLKQLMKKEDLDCGRAIVSFEYQEQRENVVKEFKRVSYEQLQRHFESSKIKVKKCPQPYQINWQNVNVQSYAQKKRIIISWTIFIAILAAFTVGFYYLLNYKVLKVQHHEDTKSRAINYSSLIIIIIFNKFIFANIIHHLVEFQKHKSGQSSQFSLMLKYSLGLFFTTAVMTIMVQGVTHHNVYKQQFGIVQQETVMFFFTAFLVPLIWLINPWYLWKLFQRKIHKDTPYMTQQEANKLMQDPQYLMGKRYGQVLKSMWFTFLYACVIPLGSILMFIGIFLYYWIDKYNLLRKSSILEGVSGNLCMKALFLLDFILILKPAGELIFDGLIRHTWSVIPVITISIGAVYLLLPIAKLLQYIDSQQFFLAKQSFYQLRKRNYFGYELHNPLIKQEVLKANFEKIQNSDYDPHGHMRIDDLSQKERQHKLKRRHSIVRPQLSTNKIAIQRSTREQIYNSPRQPQSSEQHF